MADAALLGLAGTVVGGAIAVVSGWLGPWLIEGRKERAEQKKRRADKFEDLVGAVYEFDHWLDIKRGIALGGTDSEPTVSPFAKIQAIAAAYFPQFDPLIQELERTTAPYVVWIETAGFKRVSGTLEKLPDDLLDVLNPYCGARDKRRMKMAEDEAEFSRFAAPRRRAVWDQVLKTRRDLEGDQNWRPSWSEGCAYQREVNGILWKEFRVSGK